MSHWEANPSDVSLAAGWSSCEGASTTDAGAGSHLNIREWKVERPDTSVRRALAAHFVYLDELLAKTQAACGVSHANGLFYRYELDVPRARLSTVLEGITRFRHQLDMFSSTWGLDLPAQPVLSSRALAVDFQFLDIALDEMSPHMLSGYGSLGDGFEHDYGRLQEALRVEIKAMSRALLADDQRDAQWRC